MPLPGRLFLTDQMSGWGTFWSDMEKGSVFYFVTMNGHYFSYDYDNAYDVITDIQDKRTSGQLYISTDEMSDLTIDLIKAEKRRKSEQR